MDSHTVNDLPPVSDVAVIGGGIMGLWCAVRAAEAGMSVVLLESGQVGDGASGGILGALMPHGPDRWNAKKQFQLDALLSLEGAIRAIEGETGGSAGYERVGRLMPLASVHRRTQAETWAEQACLNWPATLPDGRTLAWTTADSLPHADRISPVARASGMSFDTLSARVAPRRLTKLLAQYLSNLNQSGRKSVHILERTPVSRIGADGALGTGRGKLAAGHVVVAAGVATSRLVLPIGFPPFGRGVKGQGALLRPVAPVDRHMPVIYSDGVYVIVHDDGTVAVGSTSEDRFAEPETTDDRLDALVARATALVPMLQGAEIIERWAGVRPRAVTADPLAGALPGQERIWIATGGYKISFGIAHAVADGIVAGIEGRDTCFPAAFEPREMLQTGQVSL